MTRTNQARERLLALIGPADAANQDTTPEQAIDDAIHEAILNQPSLRHCLFPGCLREYDATSHMTGQKPPRPEWSGTGWATMGRGALVGERHVCPDHNATVTAHFPRRLELPNGRWGIDCACGWSPPPQNYAPILRALWEQHLLTTMGTLPAAPPTTDPEHRIPLAEHTEDTLTGLYDRLWDAEGNYDDLRDFARSAFLCYTTAVPALMGAKTALEGLRTRITLDSRDWSADKLDALLWAVLVGWGCENTDDGHVHDDTDCGGDQGLWDIANQHNIPTDQTIQAHHHRWWIANAIKTAQQIENSAKQQEAN